MNLTVLVDGELRDLGPSEGVSITRRERVVALLSWRTLPGGEGRLWDVVGVCDGDVGAEVALDALANTLRNRLPLCDLRSLCRRPGPGEANMLLANIGPDGIPQEPTDAGAEAQDPGDQATDPKNRDSVW